MNRWTALAVLLPLGVVGIEIGALGQDGGGATQAGQLFAQRCANCHVYPDAKLATDRAWLGQIMETS